jgi:hypothetical protein
VEPGPDDHLVVFHDREPQIQDALELWAGTALLRDERLILITTRERWDACRRRLESKGFDPGGADRRGRIRFNDARRLAERLLAQGIPDRTAFRKLAAELVGEPGGPPARLYGDAVDLLAAAGRLEDAFRLEAHWGDFVREHPIPVCCGYALAHVGGAERRGRLEALHSAAI